MRYFIVCNSYKQDRTNSGRWSKKTHDHKRRALCVREYEKYTSDDTLRFFQARATRSYTKAGYIIDHVTMPYEFGDKTRVVEDYEIVELPKPALGARECFVVDNAVSASLRYDNDRELVTFATMADMTGHSDTCTYDIAARCFVA